jgi:hypothetical protein
MAWNQTLEYIDGRLHWLKSQGGAKAGSAVGCLSKDGYRVFQYRKKQWYEHRIVWEMHNGEIPDGLFIDHINRDKADNRIENLRLVTTQENGFNRGAKGYRFVEREGKWKAAIKKDGTIIHLGYFRTENEAADAYAKAKEIHHKLNTEVA